MDRLLLIDGHSVAYRAFFALPVENFATSTGQHTNSVFGFTSMLINVLRDERPSHVAIAFDVSRHTFRTDEYPEYKGTRDKSPDEFKGQLPLIEQVLQALKVPFLSKDGFEADDIIATLSRQAEANGTEVLICTGDRDCLQLVGQTTTVLYPKKGVSDLVRMTPAEVFNKYGVTPEQHPQLAALVGETSDNLPGVPGVGPKTAAKWINAYGSLDEIIAQSDSVGGKAGQSLRDHLDDVIRNRRLNRLVDDVDLPMSPADLGFDADFDVEAIDSVFDALEFDVLRTRLFDAFNIVSPHSDDDVPAPIAVERLGGGEVAKWLNNHGSAGPCGVHVMGVTGLNQPRADGLAIVNTNGACCWIDSAQLSSDDDEAIAAWWADKSKEKVMHDAKAQIHAVRAQGWDPAGVIADTAIAGYLLKPDQRSYDLGGLALRYLKQHIGNQTADDGQLAFDDGSAEVDTAASYARAICQLWPVLQDELDREAATELLTGIEMPVSVILDGMEARGIAVDSDLLADLYDEFSHTMQSAADQAYAVIERQVNLGSPKQLQEVLFDQLDMPKTKRTKTGYTTDAGALAELYAKTGHPFLEHLLSHREVTKMRQIVESLRKEIAADGRIHTTFQQTIAATGRLSSTEPNLQNIPIRTASGRRIRQVFVVGQPYQTLLTADYSQIEMRIMAHLSGDSDLIAAFKSGADFHTVMAAKVFGSDPAEITHEERARIKAMNYGLAYGLSAYGLSQQLSITPAEAQGLMDEYFSRFGNVRDYLHHVVEQARQTGYTQTMLGRRRYLPDLASDVRQRRQMAERMALNAPIQGSAADIIKRAMIEVDARLRGQSLTSRMLLQIHDELVIEIAEGELDRVTELVRGAMGDAIELSVPLDVSVGSGHSWFEAAH